MFAVRGVTGSGDTAVASSNGFYIDDSPPVFDPEVMRAFIYYDVGQGENTPVKFQKSNDTIRCIWKCEDKESDIMVSKILRHENVSTKKKRKRKFKTF